MTSNLPIIGGTYADLRQVKSRGVWQLVVDVPAEDAEKLVDLFGLPRQDEPTWLAIARLKNPPGTNGSAATQASAAQEGTPTPSKPSVPGGARKSWYEQKPSQRAGILCNEPEFQLWLVNRAPDAAAYVEEMWPHLDGAGRAAATLRIKTGVVSRSEYDTGIGLDTFCAIEHAYRVSRGLETAERR